MSDLFHTMLFVAALLPVVCLSVPVLRRGQRRREGTPQKKVWERDQTVRDLIDSEAGIRKLYADLGFYPQIEWRLDRLIRQMKGQIRAEVPDFASLRAVLKGILTQRGKEGNGGADPMSQAWAQKGEDALLLAVLAAADDEGKVLELLNRDAVGEPLPFVEQLPFLRDGTLVWRTPMGLSVIRKRPSNPTHFSSLLYELEHLVRTTEIRRSPRGRNGVLEAISRLKRDLQREDAYFPTSLMTLGSKVSEWLYEAQEPVRRGRREQLDRLLEEMTVLWHAHGLGDEGRRRVAASQAADFRDAAQRQTKAYLDVPWMHRPCLTDYLLRSLIDSELVALRWWQMLTPFAPGRVLKLVRREVTSGQYDGEENIRRLRQQERKGFFVNSLIYALLRLHNPPPAAVRQTRLR